MATILPTKSIYYNDVTLIAQYADKDFKSRSDVPNEKERIIVSPMEAVIGEKFVIEAARCGISVCLHRFNSLEWQYELYQKFNANRLIDHQSCFCSVGLDNFKDSLRYFHDRNVMSVGLDIANGYLNLEHLGKVFHEEKFLFENFYCGNVHTADGCLQLAKTFQDACRKFCDVPMIRVGIGGGSPCSTSDMTGINRGNITEIIECVKYADHPRYPYTVIADGGISKPANACKALAAGAEYVMCGGYFADAQEAETNVSGDGSYWGGASKKQLKKLGQLNKHSEGKILTQPRELKPLKELVDDMWGGITSYVSYSGFLSLTDAIGKGVFEIKENSLPPRNR